MARLKPPALSNRLLRREPQRAQRSELKSLCSLCLCGSLLPLHDGKHLPKANNNLGDPLSRIFRLSSAHTRLRSFARKPSHVLLSAVTCRSAFPLCPSLT